VSSGFAGLPLNVFEKIVGGADYGARERGASPFWSELAFSGARLLSATR
jgi:hypothetical protein